MNVLPYPVSQVCGRKPASTPTRETHAVQKFFKMIQKRQLHRLYCGSFAITLISKSKPDSQVTPIAVTVG